MELKLVRKNFTQVSTIGELFIDGKFECFILEDIDRGLDQRMETGTIKSIKVYGKTAIPKGRYEIAITYSNRFKKKLPLLLDVKGFEGIRIHPGNTAADTEGCLLPGTMAGENRVLNSRVAFDNLLHQLESKINQEKVFITVE